MTFVLLFAALLLVGALTAGAASVRAVNRIWLRHWVEARLAGRARVSTDVSADDVQRLLLAASTAVALVAFAIGSVIGTRWVGDTQRLFEQTALVTMLMLVVGQLIPRAIGRRWAARLVPVFVPALRFTAAMCSPLVAAAHALAGRIGAPALPSEPQENSDRLALVELLREGELEGVGDPDESAIISGVVDFTQKTARDLMTPRERIFFAEKSETPAELLSRVVQTRYSRIPVTDGGVDHVVGMRHVFDVLKGATDALPPLRRVVYATESAVATELLYRMLREHVHLAIIRDTAGHTAGLITLDDLLEELVGDIRDEHDEPGP